MSRSPGLAHILRQDDGSSVALWGVHTLRTALQPIFAFRNGRLEATAFEGLLRPFRDDTPVSPGDFFARLPENERGQVESLARTLHLLNAGAMLDPAALVFVNFDPGQYRDRETTEAALREMRLVLHEAAVDPTRIVCEITEQTSHSDAALTSLVEALRASGYQVAVDDYGQENSDMERILSLRPDIVKFASEWIAGLMRSDPGVGLLHEMVRRFTAMGIRTVFEGIEEGWQLELAERAGVSMVQGYALARPQLAPADFSAFSSGVGALPETGSSERSPGDAAREGGRARRTFGKREG